MKKLSSMNCNTYICFVKFYKNASETPYNPLMSLTVTYILGFLIGPKCKKKNSPVDSFSCFSSSGQQIYSSPQHWLSLLASPQHFCIQCQTQR